MAKWLKNAKDKFQTCGCVLVYWYTEGITIVLLCLQAFCLAVAHCWVYCIGSCVPVHEDRTKLVAMFLLQSFVHCVHVASVHGFQCPRFTLSLQGSLRYMITNKEIVRYQYEVIN